MLDMRTVLTLTFSYGLLMGLGIIIYEGTRKKQRGLRRMGAGLVFCGLGFFIISRRDLLPNYLTIIIANMFIVGGTSLILDGLTRFRRQKVKWLYQHMVLLLVTGLSFYYYTYIQASVNNRIIIISAMILLLFSECIYILIRASGDHAAAARAFLSSYFLICNVLLILRVIVTVTEREMVSFMDAGSIHQASVLIYQVLPFVLAISTFWMSNSEKEVELTTRSMTDSLTGIYNRGAVMELAAIEFARYRRLQKPVGVAMGDLDEFKKINDQYGHHIGDQALKAVSKVIKDNIRQEDLVGRYGGEEFLLIVTDIEEAQFFKMLEAVREALTTIRIDVDHGVIGISISFGGVIVDATEALGNALVMADKALYESKDEGRNRVKIYDKRTLE